MMAKHWRRGHYRNGKWIKGGWVGGSNPKAGCQMWMLGTIALAAALRVIRGSQRRPQA
ncbi:hypothetical protein [Streptomyces sp. NPDC042319]|uniref:hypothetical protein n=1 Tax=Streptomyces sp. NPDC042319 TaxID=3154332 RepID=UPI0033D069A2